MSDTKTEASSPYFVDLTAPITRDKPKVSSPASQGEHPPDQHQHSSSEESDLLVGSSPATTLLTPSTTSYVSQARHDFPLQPPDVRKRSTKSQHSLPNHDNTITDGPGPHSAQGGANTHAIACTIITTEPVSPSPNQPADEVPSSEHRERLARPHLFRGATSRMESRYVHMVLALDNISIYWNILAAFFTWILLAGFVLFPGTFANLQAAAAHRNLPISSPIVLAAVNSITTLPLFVVASACSGIGIIGMLWLTWRWHKNYIWVLNKIFLPGFLNSLVGVLSTLANIYGTQKGEFSQPSRITLIVLISISGVCLILVATYALWLIQRIKDIHDVEVGFEHTGKHGEGITVDIEQVKKKRIKSNGGERV